VISIVNGYIVVQRPGGRIIPIQPVGEMDYYQALRAFGVRESVAAALTKGLITTKGVAG